MDFPHAEPSIYCCEKHEPVVLSPQPPIVPTPQDNRNIIEEQAKQLAKSQQDFDDYKETMEARFDKLATMLQALAGSK
jgi:hypothetical protein